MGAHQSASHNHKDKEKFAEKRNELEEMIKKFAIREQELELERRKELFFAEKKKNWTQKIAMRERERRDLSWETRNVSNELR